MMIIMIIIVTKGNIPGRRPCGGEQCSDLAGAPQEIAPKKLDCPMLINPIRLVDIGRYVLARGWRMSGNRIFGEGGAAWVPAASGAAGRGRPAAFLPVPVMVGVGGYGPAAALYAMAYRMAC